jgi:hypothetical protein
MMLTPLFGEQTLRLVAVAIMFWLGTTDLRHNGE